MINAKSLIDSLIGSLKSLRFKIHIEHRIEKRNTSNNLFKMRAFFIYPCVSNWFCNFNIWRMLQIAIPTYHCGKTFALKYSWTNLNPGKRFFGCRKYGVSEIYWICKIFSIFVIFLLKSNIINKNFNLKYILHIGREYKFFI